MMTQDKAENLLFAVEDRQFVLGKTSHWMKYLAEQVKDAREEAFSHYNAKSQLIVKDVFQAWWHMRRAQENLHRLCRFSLFAQGFPLLVIELCFFIRMLRAAGDDQAA